MRRRLMDLGFVEGQRVRKLLHNRGMAAYLVRGTLIALRRDFHRHPELSLQEFRTAQRIEEELDRLDIPHTRVGETGVLGTLRGTGSGDGVMVLRADMDALPIQEANSVDYCSQTPGVMHACGHDANVTCLLGAAKVLARRRDRFGGEVRLVFQPAEEIGQGAKAFVDAVPVQSPSILTGSS